MDEPVEPRARFARGRARAGGLFGVFAVGFDLPLRARALRRAGRGRGRGIRRGGRMRARSGHDGLLRLKGPTGAVPQRMPPQGVTTPLPRARPTIEHRPNKIKRNLAKIRAPLWVWVIAPCRSRGAGLA